MAEDGTLIISDPDTLGGTPLVRGHRIGVVHILGSARDAILEITRYNYPQLTPAEVNAAIDYAIRVVESKTT